MTRDLRTYYSQRRSVCSRPFINSLQARRKQFLSGTATGEGNVGSGHPSARSGEFFFTFIFQLSGLALVPPLCFALHLPRLYIVMGQGGNCPPEKLASEYNKILFVHSSQLLSYHGLTCPTELFQSRIRSSDIQLSEQRNLRMRKSMSSKKPVRPWPDRPEWVLRPCITIHYLFSVVTHQPPDPLLAFLLVSSLFMVCKRQSFMFKLYGELCFTQHSGRLRRPQNVLTLRGSMQKYCHNSRTQPNNLRKLNGCRV